MFSGNQSRDRGGEQKLEHEGAAAGSSSQGNPARGEVKRRAHWGHTWQGFSKIRKTIAAPAKAFGVNVPILPPGFSARFRMINDPIFGLAERLDEGAMAHAPYLRGLLEDRPMLAPRGRI